MNETLALHPSGRTVPLDEPNQNCPAIAPEYRLPRSVSSEGVLLMEVWLLYCKSKMQEATSKSLNDKQFLFFFFTMAMFKEQTHCHIL